MCLSGFRHGSRCLQIIGWIVLTSMIFGIKYSSTGSAGRVGNQVALCPGAASSALPLSSGRML